MEQVARAVPILPVPLVAVAFRRGLTEAAEITAFAAETLGALKARDVVIPRRSAPELVRDGLALWAERGVRSEADDPDLVAFYAASIAHHLD